MMRAVLRVLICSPSNQMLPLLGAGSPQSVISNGGLAWRHWRRSGDDLAFLSPDADVVQRLDLAVMGRYVAKF